MIMGQVARRGLPAANPYNASPAKKVYICEGEDWNNVMNKSIISDRSEGSEPEPLAGVPFNRQQLRRLLDEHVSEEEVRTICLAMQINYDDLPAQGRSGKIRELILFCERRQRYDELCEKVLNCRDG
jgi:hypothetical protein